MSSNRHWNVERHIQRRHGGTGEPVRYDATQYYKDINPQNFRSPFDYSDHRSLFLVSPKEKPHKNFSDLIEDNILQPLRKVVEYKNLLSQLSTTQPQQQRMIPRGGSVYTSIPSITLDSDESNNNLSEHPRFDDDDDVYSEMVGFRGHVCEKCSIINIDTIFRHEDEQSGKIETTHTCNSKRLSDIQLNPGKDKIINNQQEKLLKTMNEKVKSWTKNSPYLVAFEMPPNAPENISLEIAPTDESHWAVRALKDKQTILNDKELSDFLCKARNATYASFNVISPTSQQQQQQKSSTRRYLMIITDNKINLSFDLLLQYIADLSR